MIKRIRLATRRADVPDAAFAAAWPHAVAAAALAPADVRPARIAVCVTLPDLTGPDPRHDGVGIEWFADAGHLRRFCEWLATPAGRRLQQLANQAADPDASPVVVVGESVLRGAGWLERRWRDGGEKLKHMAIASRARDLTTAEFSARWRRHAGQVRRPGAGRAGAVTAIPDGARGRAYIQNHPCPRPAGEWAYDALNEVYVDDVASLRARVEWFRANLPGQAEDDLFRQSWFMAVREQAVLT